MNCQLCDIEMDFEEEDNCYHCGYCGDVIERKKG